MNSEKDMESWYNIIKDISPIKSNLMPYVSHNKEPIENNLSKYKKSSTFSFITEEKISYTPLKNTFVKSNNITNGLFSSIDHNTKLKIDKGKYPINSTIDLHGYNIDEAYDKLMNFIIDNYSLGNKCLLVITGWGSKNYGNNSIKNSLHKWLSNERIANMILYYKQAAQHHGGKGAFYILLRKKGKK